MSSLFSALRTSFSALSAINTAIQVTGDNIANANNADYNRQIEVYQDVRGGGVKITDIKRLADEALRNDFLRSSTTTATDTALSGIYDQLEQLTGSGLGQTYLSNTIQEFGDAWKAYEASPENYAAEREVVRIGHNLQEEFKRLSIGIDSFETQIKQDLVDQVAEVNNLLTEVNRLNEYIVRDQSKGISTSEYQNNRDATLTELAKLVDFRSYGHDNGAITLYTPEGLSLVDMEASQFTWDLNTMSLTLKGNDGNLLGSSYMPGGEIGTRINIIRTDVDATDNADYKYAPLQKFRNQLDELAYSFVDDSSTAAIGKVPSNTDDSLSVISGIAVGDTFTLQAITIDDTTGAEVLGIEYIISITANTLTNQPMTMDELVASINAQVTPTGEPQIRARVTAHGTLEINTTEGKLVLTDTEGTALADMRMISGTTQTFEERNPPTFAKAYNDAATADGFSDTFFEAKNGNVLETSRLNFQINIDLFNAKSTVKDQAGNAVMSSLYSNNRSLSGSGSDFTRSNYLGLASGILSDLSGRASHATSSAQTSLSLSQGMERTLRNKVGVDIDEEMMRLTILENSYSAAATALNTIQKMFDALEAAV